MAQPIEIAFSLIRDHKAYRRLNCTERGIFVALVQACLLDGIDPLPAQPTKLQALCSATPRQWQYAQEAVLVALSELLSKLKGAYEKTFDRREKLRINQLMTQEKKRLARRAASFTQCEAQSFADGTALSGIIQPFKATKYTPNDYDQGQRQAAVSARETLQGKDRPLKD